MSSHEPQSVPRGAGAMTVAMRAVGSKSERHALRIGVVRDGKILHDRTLWEPGVISVGRSEQSTFVVSGKQLPSRTVLFEIDAEGFWLRLAPMLAGRIVLEGVPRELSALGEVAVTRDDGSRLVRLSRQTRGKLSFGEVSVLFECVDAPVLATRAQLPMGVRTNLGSSVDWLFTAFVMGSFLLHFGFVVLLENADRPLEDVAERIRSAQLLIDEPPPPDIQRVDPPIPPDIDDDGQASNPANPKGKVPARPDSNQAKHGDRSAANPADAAALAAEAMRQAENLMLGVASLSGGGAFVDLLRHGAVTTDADDLFATVNGSTVAIKDSASLLPMRDAGEGERTKGLGSLMPGRHGTEPIADGSPIREADVHGKVDPGEAEDEGGMGELDAAEVTREIKKRLGAIRACYEHALRRDAGLAGKLVVSFTVEQTGSLSHVAVRETSVKDAGLSQCVASSIASIRMLHGPRGGSVDFSYPFVFKGEL